MSSIAVRIDSSVPRTAAARSSVVGRLGVDHLADVVVKLDQVDEDRPLDLEQEVLLVLLKLGVQAVDDPLRVDSARTSRSKLAWRNESRSSTSRPSWLIAAMIRAGDSTRGGSASAATMGTSSELTTGASSPGARNSSRLGRSLDLFSPAMTGRR